MTCAWIPEAQHSLTRHASVLRQRPFINEINLLKLNIKTVNRKKIETLRATINQFVPKSSSAEM